jgi:hypothetical protein
MVQSERTLQSKAGIDRFEDKKKPLEYSRGKKDKYRRVRKPVAEESAHSIIKDENELDNSKFRKLKKRRPESQNSDPKISSDKKTTKTKSNLSDVPKKHNTKGTSVSEKGFVKLIRSTLTDFLQEKHPNAFLLLSLIARRARRTSGHPDGLKIGECYVSTRIL